MKTIFLLLAAMSLLGACSTQQMYASTQQWQRNECRKVIDAAERRRCEKSSASSFEAYSAERDALRPK